MVGILFWELVQRKIDENMHWKIIISLLETKFKITKTTVFYKAKFFKQIYVKTMWAKLDAFSLMVVKKTKKTKKKPLPSLMHKFSFLTKWDMKPIKLCVCVHPHMCTCMLDFNNTQNVILASNLSNNILLVSACMTLLLSFYYFLTRGYNIMDLLL